MNTKKFIFIPVVNNFELLKKAIDSVPNNLFDEYFIFNNSNGKIPIDVKHFKIIDKFGRLTFKQTQNAMREYAIINNYDYYCFMHNDGEIVDDSAKKLIEKADKLITNNIKWSAIFTNYDVFCAYSTNCVKHIGKWGDPLWPINQQSGYYLDNDYYRRMNLLYCKPLQLNNSNVLHNEYSNTIKDKNEKKLWDVQRKIVENHYIKKWGGLPDSEIYLIPKF
jgi:hypothetical protein